MRTHHGTRLVAGCLALALAGAPALAAPDAPPPSPAPPGDGRALLPVDTATLATLDPDVRAALASWHLSRPCVLNGGKPKTAATGCVVRVPGGRFVMGAQSRSRTAPNYDPLALPDEGPPARVVVENFWLEVTEVAQQRFEACLRAGACLEEDQAVSARPREASMETSLRPARGVTWAGADRFCQWIGARLPTEAEWERAARGKDARRFPWGNELLGCNTVLAGQGHSPDCPPVGPIAVTSMSHPGDGPYGHRGLAGNVWEWTADWYAPYPPGPRRPPTGPLSGERKVQRGGAFDSEMPDEIRSARRAALAPGLALDDVGFRCAATRLPGLPRPAPPAKGPASPFAGRWTLSFGGNSDVRFQVDRDGRIALPGGLGRVSSDGVLSAYLPDQLLLARCTSRRCEGELRTVIGDGRAPLTMERER